MRTKFMAAALAAFIVLSFAGCHNEDTTEQSSITDFNGGISGDQNIDEISDIKEESNISETAIVNELLAANTEYSERYANFKYELINQKVYLKYTINKGQGNIEECEYANSGANWYYYEKSVEGDKTTESAYINKNDNGFSFDYDKKVCIVIPSDSRVKIRTDVIPIFDGVKFVEQTEELFNGVKYDCDIYDFLTVDYADDDNGEKQSKIRKSGYAKVFYKDGQIVAETYKHSQDTSEIIVTFTEVSDTVDKSIFDTNKTGFKKVTPEEYLES